MVCVLVAGCGTAGSAGPGKQKNAGRLVVERLLSLAAGVERVVVPVRTEAAAAELRRLSRGRLHVLVGD